MFPSLSLGGETPTLRLLSSLSRQARVISCQIGTIMPWDLPLSLSPSVAHNLWLSRSTAHERVEGWGARGSRGWATVLVGMGHQLTRWRTALWLASSDHMLYSAVPCWAAPTRLWLRLGTNIWSMPMALSGCLWSWKFEVLAGTRHLPSSQLSNQTINSNWTDLSFTIKWLWKIVYWCVW